MKTAQATVSGLLGPGTLHARIDAIKRAKGTPPWSEKIVVNEQIVGTLICQPPGHPNDRHYHLVDEWWLVVEHLGLVGVLRPWIGVPLLNRQEEGVPAAQAVRGGPARQGPDEGQPDRRLLGPGDRRLEDGGQAERGRAPEEFTTGEFDAMAGPRHAVRPPLTTLPERRTVG